MGIKIQIGGIEHVYHVPKSFDEMNQSQYLAVVDDFLNDSQDLSPKYAFLQSIIEPEVFSRLGKYHKWELYNQINITEKFPVKTGQNLVDSIFLNGKKYYGYDARFLNTTWEEFIICDQFALDGRFPELIAVLYRQAKDNPSMEEDIRVPFTMYGLEHRFKLFNELPENIIMGIAMNYFALREKNIVPHFPRIFKKKHVDPDDHKTENVSNAKKFSWLSLHNSISVEYYTQSKDMKPLPVKDVLKVMDAKIKQDNDSKRKR
jgi:hypothetical protein